MESLSQQPRDVNLSDDFYVGSDLSNKANLLEKAKEKIEEQVASSNCGLFIRKRIMCLSVELSVILFRTHSNNSHDTSRRNDSNNYQLVKISA